MKSSTRALRYRKTYDEFLAELGPDSTIFDRTILSLAAIMIMTREDHIADFLANGNDSALEAAVKLGDAALDVLKAVGLLG